MTLGTAFPARRTDTPEEAHGLPREPAPERRGGGPLRKRLRPYFAGNLDAGRPAFQ